MVHPHLAFCPYLPVAKVIEFGDWEIGPLDAFEGRWSDPRFEARAKAFLKKFVGNDGAPVRHPSILCRKARAIDGALPPGNEVRALESTITFALLEVKVCLGQLGYPDLWRSQSWGLEKIIQEKMRAHQAASQEPDSEPAVE